MEAQLPDALKQVLRLDEVTVEKSHFVDENMAEFESDLLFRETKAWLKQSAPELDALFAGHPHVVTLILNYAFVAGDEFDKR